jgi:hypothetical protein
VEAEGRIDDLLLRENHIDQGLAYQRWKALRAAGLTLGAGWWRSTFLRAHEARDGRCARVLVRRKTAHLAGCYAYKVCRCAPPQV